MVINKKILLYSLLAGSACIASHAWSMDNDQVPELFPVIQGWTNTTNMAPSSSSSSSQPSGHRSYGSIVPGDLHDQFTVQLILAIERAVHPAPTVAHTSGGTKEEEEEEAGPSELKRRRTDNR